MKLNYVISSLFAAITLISLPVTILLTPDDAVIESENRVITPFPKMAEFTKGEFRFFFVMLDKYVEDRLPFKDVIFKKLAQYYNDNITSVNFPTAIEGNNDWLFLGDSYKNVISQHIKDLPLDLEENAELIQLLLAMKNAYPKAYTTVLVCPDKHGIYWEELPNYLRQKKEYRLALKKIHNLREHNVNVIDLYPALKAEHTKKDNILYYKTDTHWSPNGAEAGFREFYRQLSDKISLSPLNFDLYEYSKKDNFQGDLVVIGGFYNHKETISEFIPKYKVDWIYNGEKKHDYSNLTVNLAFPNTSHYMTNSRAPNDLRVFWCGDSFSIALAPFVNLAFKHVHYLSGYNCKLKNNSFLNDLREFKPDLIIYEIIERNCP